MIDQFADLVNRLNSISGEPRASVLIIHLYVEYFVNEILKKKLPKPKKIIDKYTFAKKVDIIESLKILTSELINDIRQTNKIRNLFAHNIETDSIDFQNELLKEVKKLSSYDRLNDKSKMTPYDIFNIVSIQIHHKIRDAVNNL